MLQKGIIHMYRQNTNTKRKHDLIDIMVQISLTQQQTT